MTLAVRILARSEAHSTRVRAYAFASKDPPPEIQLWNVGANETDYGIHIWNDRSIAEVMARYTARGNPLLVDVEHGGAVDEDGEPAATGGYARLEIRDGAPWLVFDWSAYAIEQIATRQRLFLSPEYDVDANTNEIIRLYRVSLVADPGTYRARVLAGASTGERTMDIAVILAALRAALTAEDPAVAKDSIASLVAELEKQTTGGTTDPVVDDPAPPAEPVFAAGDDKKDDDKKDDDGKKKTVAAAATPAPAAVTLAPVVVPPAPIAPPPAGETEHVRAARESAMRSENALRDLLIEQHGHRLVPSIRTWASSQPLAVVRGLVAAAPEPPKAPAKVSATRGATHGTERIEATGELEGPEREALRMKMGTSNATTPKVPYTNEAGNRVFPMTTPREFQRVMAARTAEKGNVR